MDDLTKISKGKADHLKLKDSAIRIKLELAKLQSDIIKSRGDSESAIVNRSNGAASLNDFKSIRKMLQEDSDLNNASEGE